MKQIYLLLSLIFTCSIMTAQNRMIKDFGTSYDEIRQFLSESNFKANYDDPSKIDASNGSLNVKYHFNDGQLFKQTIQRTFESKKDAKVTMDSFRSFYTLVGASMLNKSEDKKSEHFVAIKELKMNKVKMLPNLNKGYDVELVSSSVQFSPAELQASLSEEYATIYEKINNP